MDELFFIGTATFVLTIMSVLLWHWSCFLWGILCIFSYSASFDLFSASYIKSQQYEAGKTATIHLYLDESTNITYKIVGKIISSNNSYKFKNSDTGKYVEIPKSFSIIEYDN